MRAALLAIALLLVVAPAASAVDRVVTTTADGNDGVCNAQCTLREALVVGVPGDVVLVPAGTFQLTGELIAGGEDIRGAGARATTIRGDGTNRVLTADDGDTTLSGVTVTNGGGGGLDDPGDGGGILVAGHLTLVNSHVAGNRASGGSGGGISIGSGSRLDMAGSTVSGNVVEASSASGGGIYMVAETDFVATNSTISGNRVTATDPADALGGGLYSNGYTATLNNVTIAGNTAGVGGGVYLSSGETVLANTIVADNVGGACAAGAVEPESHHSLASDGSCGLTGPGNLQGVAAQLGGLANNGGPTDTRALAASSPAVNAGSGCAATDQRGVTRDAACDIGAFEYRAASLTVTTSVVNDQGGTADATEFSVHVRSNGADVAGSPGAPAYTLAPGSYQVAADALRGYTFTYGGSCASDGSVSLADGQAAACTIVANDPAPTLNRTVNGTPKSGTIKVKLPGRNAFRTLREGEQLPNGTVVDTTRGKITLTVAAANGKVSKADFYDGIFKFKQAKGLTTLTLVEKLTCKSAKKAGAAAKKKTKRRLWGDGKGRFQTKGKHSAATVVGTKWLVEDTCTTTLTRVVRGRVSVRDLVKKKTVLVRAGKRYIARAR